MKNINVATNICLFLIGMSAYQAAADSTLSFRYAGVARTYILHVPANYQAGKSYPLLLAFHPHLGTSAGMATLTNLEGYAKANQFFIAYPNSNPNYGDGRSWDMSASSTNDVEFSVSMLENIEAAYNIDSAKVYLSGFSEGGGMVHWLACQHTPLFAGAAVISANLNPASMSVCRPSQPIKMLHFHGTDDPIVPYYGGLTNGAGAPHETTSALQTAQFWAASNGCSKRSSTKQIADVLANGAPVTDLSQAWLGCPAGGHVVFYTITGGGHTYPGDLRRGRTRPVAPARGCTLNRCPSENASDSV